MQAMKTDNFLEEINKHPILSRVGKTPLLEIRAFREEFPEVRVLAKAEYYNPGGSVKDRPALNMVKKGIEEGRFNPKTMTLIEATSGNTGIALAMIGAALSFKVCLCLPQNASAERKSMLRAYHAEIIETDPTQSTDGAVMKARELVKENPNTYFYPDQYSNENNWKAHYETTGPEIWEQTKGSVTHFVTGLGTTGTFMGVTRFLKEKNSRLQTFSMEPDGPLHGLEGLKHMETSMVPEIYEDIGDGKIFVKTETAQDMVLYMARSEALFIGPSGGGNLVAAYEVAKKIKKGVIVTVLPDSGALYLSDKFWSEQNARLPNS